MSEDSAIVDRFRAEHRRIQEQLAACDAVAGQVLVLTARLKELQPLLLAHLDAKDTFYPRLMQRCSEHGDLASANVAKIFSDNMTVQSAAIRRFFATLDAPASPLLAQSYSTMALIIRNRLTTEERAVFPLYLKHVPR